MTAKCGHQSFLWWDGDRWTVYCPPCAMNWATVKQVQDKRRIKQVPRGVGFVRHSGAFRLAVDPCFC